MKQSNATQTQQQARQYYRRHGVRIKSPEEIEGVRKAGELVLELLALAESMMQPGRMTGEVDQAIADHTASKGAISACLNYRGYPKHSCISINEVVCHGIPGDRILQDGDLVNVDVTPIVDGYYADASKTFLIGRASEEAVRLVEITRECLRRGMWAVKPGATLGDIGWAIQSYAEAQRCSVVRDFVGHGTGIEFHEPPQVTHFGRRNSGLKLIPGIVFTIEPMINLGRADTKILEDGWTAVTRDGSLSAQFEHTVVVTEDGFESLTPYEPEFYLSRPVSEPALA